MNSLKQNRLIPLSVFIIIFFFYACGEKGKIENRSEYADFRFTKIKAFIDDSAHYFKAVDSIYADLPPFRRNYEKYNRIRGYYFTYKRDYSA